MVTNGVKFFRNLIARSNIASEIEFYLLKLGGAY